MAGCGVIFNARAQGDAQLTQYWAVPTYYNPAATGETDFIRVLGGAKLQWVGIKHAPMSFLATADMPFKLGKKHRFGVGVAFNQESIGLFGNLGVSAQLSYKFKFLKGEWSVGVQPGYYNSKFKGSEVDLPEGDDYHESTDQYIPTNDVNGNAFDISAGVLYTHKFFHVGVSMLHITEPTVTLGNEGGSDSETIDFQTVLPRQTYFTVGGNIPLKNSLFSLQPSVLVRTDFIDATVDATLRATYNKLITFGVAYRYQNAVSAMLGVEFKNFFLGYAYDYPLSDIARGSSGSHELIIGYKVKLNLGGKNKNKQRSIRIM